MKELNAGPRVVQFQGQAVDSYPLATYAPHQFPLPSPVHGRPRVSLPEPAPSYTQMSQASKQAEPAYPSPSPADENLLPRKNISSHSPTINSPHEVPANNLNITSSSANDPRQPTQRLADWWRQISPVAYLENKSSVARDHLANERTFLAWLRTSLGLTSAGVAITQLFEVTTQLPSLKNAADNSFNLAQLNQSAASLPTNELVQLLFNTVQQQQLKLEKLASSSKENRTRNRRVAEPIGISFIVLGYLSLLQSSENPTIRSIPPQ